MAISVSESIPKSERAEYDSSSVVAVTGLVVSGPLAVERLGYLVCEPGEVGSFGGVEVLRVRGGFEPDQLSGDHPVLIWNRRDPGDFTDSSTDG